MGCGPSTISGAHIPVLRSVAAQTSARSADTTHDADGTCAVPALAHPRRLTNSSEGALSATLMQPREGSPCAPASPRSMHDYLITRTSSEHSHTASASAPTTHVHAASDSASDGRRTSLHDDFHTSSTVAGALRSRLSSMCFVDEADRASRPDMSLTFSNSACRRSDCSVSPSLSPAVDASAAVLTSPACAPACACASPPGGSAVGLVRRRATHSTDRPPLKECHRDRRLVPHMGASAPRLGVVEAAATRSASVGSSSEPTTASSSPGPLSASMSGSVGRVRPRRVQAQGPQFRSLCPAAATGARMLEEALITEHAELVAAEETTAANTPLGPPASSDGFAAAVRSRSASNPPATATSSPFAASLTAAMLPQLARFARFGGNVVGGSNRLHRIIADLNQHRPQHNRDGRPLAQPPTPYNPRPVSFWGADVPDVESQSSSSDDDLFDDDEDMDQVPRMCDPPILRQLTLDA